ncbi:MAG: stalk domain-containing protein [Bacillota bacterium]
MRKTAVMAAVLVMMLAAAGSAYAAPSVVVDDMTLILDQPPVIEQGRVLVPLRAVATALGAETQWDGAARTVTITKAQTTVAVTIGITAAYTGGTRVELDVPPKIVNGRTLVPFRFVSEALGADVNWDGDTQTVTVTGGGLEAAVSLTEADDGGSVELKEGDFLEVALDGNPTTGYTWMAAVDAAVLRQVCEPMFQPETGLIGSGGTITLRFRADAAGVTEMELVYLRPWESVMPLKTFEVTVTVSSPESMATARGTGEACRFDLNGDGELDTIKFNCLEGGESYTLNVNNLSVTGQGDNLDGLCQIVDVDSKDKLKEITVSESGPSDDYATAFYYYDGERIVSMGRVEGSASTFLKVDGSGTVETKTRGATIHTWFYPDYYRLSGTHLLERVPQELYEMNHKVRVKRELALQKSRAGGITGVVLIPGEEAVLVGSDDKGWCLVENSEGMRGWFAYEGYNTISGTQLTTEDVFEGLCYAD